MTVTELVVVHAFGDPDGGARWAEAFAAWPGPVFAPDLPGHRDTPPASDNEYGGLQELFWLTQLLLDRPAERVVLGIGTSGASASLLCLGGRALAGAHVDGLGGPWLTGPERMAAWRENRRRRVLVRDQPWVPGSVDPLIAGGTLPHQNRDLAASGLTAMPVPFLVVETPASAVSSSDADAVVADAGRVDLVRVATDPDAIAAAVIAWWRGLPTP